MKVLGFIKRNRSVRGKLILIIMTTCLMVLLLASASFIVYDSYRSKKDMLHDITAIAMLIADRSTAALLFDDPRLAEENLFALRVKPSVDAACIYGANGSTFAVYNKVGAGVDRVLPSAESERGYRFERDHLLLFEPILSDGKRIGAVYISTSLAELNAKQWNTLLLVAGVMLLSAVAAFFLSARFQQYVSEPLKHLTETAKHITLQNDYSVRATRNSDDEIGTLVTAFNEMLETISAKNKELESLIFAQGREIVERKRVEASLQLSEKKFGTIFRENPLPLAVSEFETGLFLEVNGALLTLMHATTPEQMLGRTSIEIGMVTLAERVKIVDAVRTIGCADHLEIVMTNLDGEAFVTELTSTSYELSGKRYLLSCILDISERKRAEQSQKLNSQRTQTLLQLNQMTGASLQEITDFALEEAVRLTQSKIGYLAFLNEDESILTMHSWSRSAMAECAIDQKPIIYPVASTGLWGEAVRQRQAVITNDYAAENPLKRSYPQGHVVVKRHMNIPVFDGSRIVIVAGVGNKAEGYDQEDVQQLTLLMEGMWRMIERRQAEEELARHRDHLEDLVRERTTALQSSQQELVHAVENLNSKKEELEAANRKLLEVDHLKSLFIASMSHELRTPLNSIIGFTGILLQGLAGELNTEQRKQLGMVKSSSEHLLSLITDIIDLSKIEAGKIDLSTDSFELAGMVGEVLGSFLVLAERKSLTLSAEIPHGLMLVSDKRRVRQVLVNLVGNSLKFTEQGGVSVTAREEDGFVKVAVRDTGMGIKAEDLGKLFKSFSQVTTAESPKHEGTGLGLYLSRRLINLLGGEIRVESEFGKGSVFSFTLPIKQ